MRMIPSRVFTPTKPLKVKGAGASQLRHLTAPLKGLNLSSRLSVQDPLTAGVLTNFNVLDDRIRSRAGYQRIRTLDAFPVATLIPWGGIPGHLIAACNNKLFKVSDGTVIKSGFTGNEWSWTMFANLSQTKYLLMANGVDGLWSYDGTTAPIKETITAAAGVTFFDQNRLNIVLTHMNRLFFADTSNLCIYYLPIQQKSGEVKVLPIGSFIRKGGYITAMYSWTMDGGAGMDDKLVVFTSNGECVIYQGVDPDSNWSLVGIFKLDSPKHKSCMANYGGDLYVVGNHGLTPLSAMIADSDKISEYDKNVADGFKELLSIYGHLPGCGIAFNSTDSTFVCNLPAGGANKYTQYVRHMPDKIWTKWENIPARSWAWSDGKLYFGDDSGRVYEMSELYLNDDSRAIKCDVQLSWGMFGTSAIKHFKMMRTYLTTDGEPRPLMEVRVDYDTTKMFNEPDVSFAQPGAIWDLATWDVDYWATGMVEFAQWQGVASTGRVGAPRVKVSLNGAKLEITGFDVIYETGSVLG